MEQLEFRGALTALLAAALVCVGALPSHAQVGPATPAVVPWSWVDGGGRARTAGEFSAVVVRHQLWARTAGAEGSRADFTRANLQSLKLAGVSLERAILAGTDLTGAELTAVNLSGANLSSATLTNAKLQSVLLERTDMHGAYLSQTQISNSELHQADLSAAAVLGSEIRDSDMKRINLQRTSLIASKVTGCLLDDADMRWTGIIDTDLTGSKLYGADLEDAVYEPSGQPDLRGIANGSHIERMIFLTSPDALTALHKAFVDGGYADQRNRITYAIEHQQNEFRWKRARAATCAEPTCHAERLSGRECESGLCRGRWLNYIAYASTLIGFDWTVRYGMAPEHALVLLMELWLLFSVIYAAVLHTSGRSGLVLVKRRTRRTDEVYRQRRVRPRAIAGLQGHARWWHWLSREWHLLRVSMFFSLLSTFHSGFNDIDPGKWIRLLTTREFNLEPTRWMRSIAGVQTVMSLFLFAMWILTQFGHPFES
ncbi:MAG: pentapeptide repeat-containing protein [Vicinamibacterales bacterium]